MELKESKAIQIINTYLKFCEALQREGKITDNNFNRIAVHTQMRYKIISPRVGAIHELPLRVYLT
jgi:hypothetical protein